MSKLFDRVLWLDRSKAVTTAAAILDAHAEERIKTGRAALVEGSLLDDRGRSIDEAQRLLTAQDMDRLRFAIDVLAELATELPEGQP